MAKATLAPGEANPKVEWYFEKHTEWQPHLNRLRRILLETVLVEELKWGVPCYTYEGRNVVLMHVFKEYCALLFHKGALLQDTDGLLVQQTENVQSARQVRFTSADEISRLAQVVKAYVHQAIEVERAGLKVPMKKSSDLVFPEEFQERLNGDAELKAAFEALTPGRQRSYYLYFTGAKQAKTRVARIEKCIPLIFDGKGWNE